MSVPTDYPESAAAYDLEETIGRGGFGIVCSAKVLQGPHTNELVAIKIMELDGDAHWDLFELEMKVMSLLDHPNVVRSYCSFVEEEELWLVMPLCNGGSCLDVMKNRVKYQNGFDDEILIATILRETLRGLVYLHEDSRIHRDVKSGNILLSRSGEVRLADYGVAGSLMDAGQKKNHTGTFSGTPAWMAPEVMEQDLGHDCKADIWSLGITALELAFGKPPYAHYPAMKILMLTLNKPPPSTSSYADLAGKVSKSFKNLVETCLKRDPVKRPSAKELLKHKFFKKAANAEYIQRILFSEEEIPPPQNPHLIPPKVQLPPPQKIRKAISIGPFDFGDESSPKKSRSLSRSSLSRSSLNGSTPISHFSTVSCGRFSVEIEEPF
uniref:Serine/threonine-protein kinase BLUS1-like n=1 Tax=Hirondellea gigas TaxID=1518452 RepID=A0A6A7GC05_9CRUS